jgi:small conductance mechanosensitive channel
MNAANLSTLETARNTLIDLAIRFGPKLAVAILILIAGVIVAGWVARASDRSLSRLDLEPPVRQLLTRLARVLVLGLFLIVALQNLGVELLPLIAGLSVAGAGLALATQGVLSNVVAGLTIIFTKPYRVDDYIAIAGVEGRVAAISMFNTVLAHADQSNVVVPNRKVVGEILHNFGRIRQSEVKVHVAYDSDLPRTLGMIGDLVRSNPRVLSDPPPVIHVAALGESGIQIEVKPWTAVADYGAAPGELRVSIAESLRRAGISIPFPQHEVRLIGGPAGV